MELSVNGEILRARKGGEKDCSVKQGDQRSSY